MVYGVFCGTLTGAVPLPREPTKLRNHFSIAGSFIAT
jgi:hypothetical protein